ncbi:MAG TPA: alpha/beta hydrolase-fold protein [Chitinophagaceae bacterium]
MQAANASAILIENIITHSKFLQREVKIDFYFPNNLRALTEVNLLLINDGQNMKELGLVNILESLQEKNHIHPIICVAIHAGQQRKTEYGIAMQADYLGRGEKAPFYTTFIIDELLPLVAGRFHPTRFTEKAFAGFSLGGLMALDIVWNYPTHFNKAGIFSGSLWWRSLDHTDADYEDELHRIMHQQIKKGKYRAGLKFFLTTGSFDETHDRNNNGIIDSIDDTLALISELESLGYYNEKDICYINYEDGKHDIATWARAMPEFLKWGWGKRS